MYRRLAVIVDTFPRWSERFIARELQELLRRGVDLTVFCLNAGKLPADEEWQELASRRVVLPPIGSLRELAGAAGPWTPEYQQRIGAAWRAMGRRALLRFGTVRALARMLREGGFEQVHAHFANLPSSLAWVAAADAQISFSFSVHARDLFVEPQLLAEKLRDCVRVFACHERAWQHLRSLARTMPEPAALLQKIVLMRHGLPLEDYSITNDSGPARLRTRAPGAATAPCPAPPCLLAAGRFVAKKGFDLLLDALAHPALAGRCTARLVGDGPEQARLSARLRQLGLEPKVTLEGPLTGAAWRACLEGSDILVLPYRCAADGDADGVPNLALEAFALGLPIVGTQAGGLGEVLTERTGVVVPENNPVALALALAAALAVPESLLARTGAARALVLERYDIRKNIEPLLLGGE